MALDFLFYTVLCSILVESRVDEHNETEYNARLDNA